jgi:hypothetical protein
MDDTSLGSCPVTTCAVHCVTPWGSAATLQRYSNCKFRIVFEKYCLGVGVGGVGCSYRLVCPVQRLTNKCTKLYASLFTQWLLHVSAKHCHSQEAARLFSELLQRQYGRRQVMERIV